MVAIEEIVWGTRELSGHVTIWLGVAGWGAMLAAGLLLRDRAKALIALSLGATAAVPWVAFMDGHPFRIRYMVPLIAIEAIAAGVLTDLVGRPFPPSPRLRRTALRTMVAIVVMGIAMYELHPLDANAPMVIEAQWDRVNAAPRHEITECLKSRYRGETIMASMGSLGHYMQETSPDGFALRDFLHEGNGDIWLNALNGPRPYAGWVLIEEKAEGGDMLAKRAREHPEFLQGFSRICEGAGVALYERQNRILSVKR
jgi:hypothetical protein